jgi:hypothetical protein
MNLTKQELLELAQNLNSVAAPQLQAYARADVITYCGYVLTIWALIAFAYSKRKYEDSDGCPVGYIISWMVAFFGVLFTYTLGGPLLRALMSPELYALEYLLR